MRCFVTLYRRKNSDLWVLFSSSQIQSVIVQIRKGVVVCASVPEEESLRCVKVVLFFQHLICRYSEMSPEDKNLNCQKETAHIINAM